MAQTKANQHCTDIPHVGSSSNYEKYKVQLDGEMIANIYVAKTGSRRPPLVQVLVTEQ